MGGWKCQLEFLLSRHLVESGDFGDQTIWRLADHVHHMLTIVCMSFTHARQRDLPA